jgi:hypothetical protein
MDGCPHCENNKPAWQEAVKKAREIHPGIKIREIERDQAPSTIRSFPTMTFSVTTTKTLVGSQRDHKVILNKLGILKGGAGRSLRGRVNGRSGKSRNRTLRRNKRL